MGIAERTSHVEFVVKPHKNNQPKLLMENAETVGDWIKAHRQGKNLTLGHIAAKMGIAASVVSSWEDGDARPNDWQRECLAKVFGLDSKNI